MFRLLTEHALYDENEISAEKIKLKDMLVKPGPDLVICDEGHLLKNDKTMTNEVLSIVRTNRKIILTGTPLQNNMAEYYCMVNVVKPHLLGNHQEFTNRFSNPITNGQYVNSTQQDIQIMKRRAHVLHKLLDGIIHRADLSVLKPFLEPKYEYAIFVRLTKVQADLYLV